jgi:hypothetical protein
MATFCRVFRCIARAIFAVKNQRFHNSLFQSGLGKQVGSGIMPDAGHSAARETASLCEPSESINPKRSASLARIYLSAQHRFICHFQTVSTSKFDNLKEPLLKHIQLTREGITRHPPNLVRTAGKGVFKHGRLVGWVPITPILPISELALA